MKYSRVFWSLALAATVCAATQKTLAETAPSKEITSFGSIKSPAVETVRAQAMEWFKGDKAKFDAIWANEDLTTLDKVAETFVQGSPEAAKLLSEVRSPTGPAPKELPELLRATKNTSAFYRNNLALIYAKALTNRRIYEDALEALRDVKVDQVADPASYYFHKAVAEHGCQHKADAVKTIAKLDDVSDAPERYRMVAALMAIDMATWQEKGLGKIGQLMETVERRLGHARGGPRTIEVEKEIIRRLEEEIKKLENQAKAGSGSGGKPGDKPGDGPPSCPSGGSSPGDGKPGDNPTAKDPQKDSYGGNAKGPGKVDPKDFENKAAKWGDLPEKDRAKAIMDSAKGLPPGTRRIIEDYYKKQNIEGGAK